MESKKEMYDVFIAYHGTYESGGSLEIAEYLAKYLLDKNLKVFFYPFSNNDAYKTNIFEVINSRTFILVANEDIHREKSKKIDHRHHYELSLEIDAFYSSTFLEEESKSVSDSKVFFCGEYNDFFIKGDEAKLHDLFKNRVHIEYNKDNSNQSFEEAYQWILSRINRYSSSSLNYSRTSNEVKHLYNKRTSLIDGENLNELIFSAKKIISIGISNSDLSTRIDQYALEECIKNGGSVEIYYLDPNGRYTHEREMEENILDERIKEVTTTNIGHAKSFKESLPENIRDNFKLYIYDKMPRLNIIFVDDYLFLQFYGFISRGMDTPSFVVQKQEGRSPLYEYCQKSYNYIKTNSKEI